MGIIVVPNLICHAFIGTNVYAITDGNSKLHVVDASNPSALNEIATYLLNGGFATVQLDPLVIASYEPGNLVFIQNAPETPHFPNAMRFGVYDATNPLAVAQVGILSFGNDLVSGANSGCDLAVNFPIVYSLLGGDTTTTPASLRAINVSNSAVPVVVGSPVLVGTFNDQPRKIAFEASTNRLYVISGTPGQTNQKCFVYDVSNPLIAPLLVSTINLAGSSIAAPFVNQGVNSFFIRNGVMNILAGNGTSGNENFLQYGTAGGFLGAATFAVGAAGMAIAGN